MQLEAALGVRLFDRTTRAVRLTAVGGEPAPAFSTLLQEIDGVVERSQDLRAKRMGIVKIGCLPGLWLEQTGGGQRAEPVACCRGPMAQRSR